MNILGTGSRSQKGIPIGATNGHVDVHNNKSAPSTRPPLLPTKQQLSASPTPESASDCAPYFSRSRTSTSTGSYQSSQFFGNEASSETETKSVSLLSSMGWGTSPSLDERPRADTKWDPRANYVGLNVSSLPQPPTRMAPTLPTERNPSTGVDDKLLLLRFYLLWRGRLWVSRISRSRHVVVATSTPTEVDTKFEAGTQTLCSNATLRTTWCVLACSRKRAKADDSKLLRMQMSTSHTATPKVSDGVRMARSEEGIVNRKWHSPPGGTKSGLDSPYADCNFHEAVSRYEKRYGNRRFISLESSTNCVAASCMADLICEGLPPHRAPEEEGLRRHRVSHESRAVLGKPRTTTLVHSALVEEQLRVKRHFHSRNPCAVVYGMSEPYCTKLGILQ